MKEAERRGNPLVKIKRNAKEKITYTWKKYFYLSPNMRITVMPGKAKAKVFSLKNKHAHRFNLCSLILLV